MPEAAVNEQRKPLVRKDEIRSNPSDASARGYPAEFNVSSPAFYAGFSKQANQRNLSALVALSADSCHQIAPIFWGEIVGGRCHSFGD